MWLAPKNPKGLYIVMISVHGLIRSKNLELGRDADTGGQTKYVIELAKALAQREEVERVDLLTRQVIDRKVDCGYADLYEKIADKALLVRIPCGPRRYLRKEVLWKHLQTFEDNVLHHIRREGRIPDLIHGHYADAGLLAGRLSRLLDVPCVFTGHSLGKVKEERLREKGIKPAKIEADYNISQRIMAEETALEAASMVVASTKQEVDEQYAAYANFNSSLARVIPPGVDLTTFTPYGKSDPLPPIFKEVGRFLREPSRPWVLALARPDERKNLLGLLEAYAADNELRKKANLVIVAGNRDDISAMETGPRNVLSKMLLEIDRHDLYGSVAYPKHHAPDEVRDIYCCAARTGGVFVNPALTEPFGLTLIEAGATGLPLVATNDGGPRDIMSNCRNGILVDPLKRSDISQALLEIISDNELWETYSRNGIKGVHKHYSWQAHVDSYLESLERIKISGRPGRIKPQGSHQLLTADRLLVSDIDNTLVGDDTALAHLKKTINDSKLNCAFGVATGRHLQSTINILRESGAPTPALVICSVGSEIYSGSNLVPDEGWANHINYQWNPEEVRRAMDRLPGMSLQSAENQNRFKISYDVTGDDFPGPAHCRRILRENKIRANIIYSHDKHMDFLPIRASKGKALRYVAVKWGIIKDNILVAGDSGNDREMLTMGFPAVVVGNFSPELSPLKKRDPENIFFANGTYASGVIEGIEHFGFLDVDSEEEAS